MNVGADDDDDFAHERRDEPERRPALAGGDYYAILNVPRDVNDEDLRVSYRRLCVLFHPDKHTNPADKEAAERNFRAVNEAYEVLADPNKRAIYDLYGVEGLRAGWQVGPKLRSQDEIRDEYERRKRQMDEEMQRRQAVTKGTIKVALDATPLFDPTTRRVRRIVFAQTAIRLPMTTEVSQGLSELLSVYTPDISKMEVAETVQFALAPGQTMSVGTTMTSRNGLGSGQITAAYASYLQSGLAYEAQLSVGNKAPVAGLKLNKALPYNTMGSCALNYTVGASNLSLVTGLQRPLYSNLVGFMQCVTTLDAVHMLGVGTLYVTDNVHVRTSLSLVGTTGQVDVATSYKLDDDTKFKAGLTVGLPRVGVQVGLDRVVAPNVRASAMFVCDVFAGVSVVFKLTMHKIGQSIAVPITLSPELSTSAVLAGLVVPSVLAYALKKFVLDPRARRARQLELEELQAEHAETTAQRRREAEESVRLMREYVERKVEAETNKNGLVIVEAQYGRLDVSGDDVPRASEASPKVVDVTVALQSLVHSSQLHLHAQSKAMLIGFYDPCIGEAKQLRIVYLFKRRLHEVTVADDEPVSLPLRSHAISTAPGDA